jgi:hypothetical protein
MGKPKQTLKAFTSVIVGTIAWVIVFCTPMGLTARAQTADFSVVRRVLGGGFGAVVLNYPPNVLPGAARILGTYRFRIINLDWDMLQGVGPGNTFKINWTQRLEFSLKLCKQYSWVPRLVWGLAPPTPLVTKMNAAEGRHYGPYDWTLFEKYTDAFLDHVVSEGFKEIEIEVGNEPDGPSDAQPQFAWWAPSMQGSHPGRIWSESLQPYLVLYRHTAEAIVQYRQNHVGIVIRVGGPASNGTSHSGFWMARPASYFNWLGGFIDAVLAQNLPLDFISWHQYYEGPGSGKQFLDAIREVRTRLARGGRANTPISISEWGLFAGPSRMVENLGPGAGVFALDFIQAMDETETKDAIFLLLAPPPAAAQLPALYYPSSGPDRFGPSHAMIAQGELAELASNRRLTCSPLKEDIRCFAAVTPSGAVDLLVWKTLWFANPSTANASSASTVRAKGVSRSGKYNIISVAINGRERPELRAQLRAEATSNRELSIDGLTLAPNEYARIKLN